MRTAGQMIVIPRDQTMAKTPEVLRDFVTFAAVVSHTAAARAPGVAVVTLQ
jgi:hypothetical protein